MSSKLHQINVQYSNKDDRILLRTSTENNDEYLIWLTRRFTKILIDIFEKEIDKRGGTTTLSSRKATKKLFTEGAFEKPYEEKSAKKHPLGKNGVLAFGIKTGTDKNNNLVLELQSELKQGIAFNLRPPDLKDLAMTPFYKLPAMPSPETRSL
ncbi:MAG: hypothetical protein O7D86_14880 [Proteobacteria bacterium]|nr:hypothetical protein [Pseudomonadota bacterium]